MFYVFKLVLTLVFFFQLCFIQAQIINTVAGNGSGSDSGDGNLATVAGIDKPCNIIFDRYGDLYIGEGPGARIRKISTSGIITTIAGTGVSGFSGDNGPATLAELKFPSGIAIDTAGNIYFCDYQANRVRKIDIITGVISTIAGTGTMGFGGDGGPATAAMLAAPQDICSDKHGNLFIADTYNNRVRKINSTGTISTVAGTGSVFFNGDNGLADTSNLNSPVGVCTDESSNLFISDNGHNKIRKVNSSGIITTIAGNGIFGSTGDGGAATNSELSDNANITSDRYGNIYISFAYPINRIRVVDSSGVISTVAGNGVGAYFGDGGLDTFAELNNPEGLTSDSCGNLYIADEYNNRIRKVTFHPDCWPSEVPQIADKQLTLYPNPVLETLYIDNVRTNARYSLFNITGIMITNGTLIGGSNTISLAGLAAGVYVVKIWDSDGVETVRRVVKW